MTLPQFLRGAARVIAGIMSVGAFILAGNAALMDHTGTTTATGTLGLALLVIAALDLESFEGFGIKAKLKSTLIEADSKVKELDKITLVLARSAFMQIARGFLSHREKRDLVEELTSALKSSRVDGAEIDKIKSPLYAFLAYKYWYGLGFIRSMYQARHASHIEKIQMRTPAGPESDRLKAEIVRLLANPESEFPTESNFAQLRKHLSQMIAKYPLVKLEDKVAFESIASDLADAFEDCMKAGNYTPDAVTNVEQLNDANSPLIINFMARLSTPGA